MVLTQGFNLEKLWVRAENFMMFPKLLLWEDPSIDRFVKGPYCRSFAGFKKQVSGPRVIPNLDLTIGCC